MRRNCRLRQKALGIDFGESTPDGLFTLRELECMAACGGAPMCQINDQEYHENLTPEKMLALIDQLAEGEIMRQWPMKFVIAPCIYPNRGP